MFTQKFPLTKHNALRLYGITRFVKRNLSGVAVQDTQYRCENEIARDQKHHQR